jgi:hypothetical protein
MIVKRLTILEEFNHLLLTWGNKIKNEQIYTVSLQYIKLFDYIIPLLI